MLKIKKKISNPMTIIAIFAVISETSATASLPFLGEEEREIYMWFLISFPFYLLFLFFITLNFNYRSLYAPSDFDKDESFLKPFSTAEPNETGANEAPEQTQPSLRADALHHKGREELLIQSNKTNRPCRVQDPPVNASDKAIQPVDENIHSAKHAGTFQIVDASEVRGKAELDAVMEKILPSDKHSDRVILIISNPVSDALLRKRVYKQAKAVKKGSSACVIVYSVNLQSVTVLQTSNFT